MKFTELTDICVSREHLKPSGGNYQGVFWYYAMWERCGIVWVVQENQSSRCRPN